MNKEEQSKYIMAMEWLNQNKDILYASDILDYISKLQKVVERLKEVSEFNASASEQYFNEKLELQKELEQEKEKNKSIVYNYEQVVDKLEYVISQSISKDKIREQIQIFKKEGSQTSLIIASVLEELLEE